MTKDEVLKIIFQRYYHNLLKDNDTLTEEQAKDIENTITQVCYFTRAKAFIDTLIETEE